VPKINEKWVTVDKVIAKIVRLTFLAHAPCMINLHYTSIPILN